MPSFPATEEIWACCWRDASASYHRSFPLVGFRNHLIQNDGGHRHLNKTLARILTLLQLEGRSRGAGMLNQPGKRACKIPISPEFRPYLHNAIMRFSYLHPSVDVAVDTDVTLTAGEGTDVADLIRDFHFTLCRQKIYAETLPLRRTLIEGVMGR